MHNNIRMMAEWEEAEAILLALPHEGTDWADILDLAIEQYSNLISALLGTGQTVLLLTPSIDYAQSHLGDIMNERLVCIEMDYNDTWTRDYGPIAVIKNESVRALDFGFNGWGLKFAADKDNLVNLRLNRKNLISDNVYRNNRDFILEGGSIESDGHGTIMTTSRCLCSPNRNGGKNKAQLNAILSERLGASHVLWLDYGELAGDDTDSHIDTLARIAPNDTILFVGCRDMDDVHFEQLLKMRAQLSMFRTSDGKPFNLVELPLPDPLFSPDGERLPATYANYLIAGHYIYMPTYGQPGNDNLALNTLKIAFPDHEIVCVDCSVLIRQHGSLHCATMQLYPGEVL